jgi:hypothetical protein
MKLSVTAVYISPVLFISNIKFNEVNINNEGEFHGMNKEKTRTIKTL